MEFNSQSKFSFFVTLSLIIILCQCHQSVAFFPSELEALTEQLMVSSIERTEEECLIRVNTLCDFLATLCTALCWPLGLNQYCKTVCVDYINLCASLRLICIEKPPVEPPVEWCCKTSECFNVQLGLPFCNPETHTCEYNQCYKDQDCPDPEKPICWQNKCRPCWNDLECYYADFYYPYCKNGQCFGCDLDYEKKTCPYNHPDGTFCQEFGGKYYCTCLTVLDCYNYYDYGCCNYPYSLFGFNYCYKWQQTCQGPDPIDPTIID